MNEFCNACGSHVETAAALGSLCPECQNVDQVEHSAPWYTTEELDNLRNEVANENSLFAE